MTGSTPNCLQMMTNSLTMSLILGLKIHHQDSKKVVGVLGSIGIAWLHYFLQNTSVWCSNYLAPQETLLSWLHRWCGCFLNTSIAVNQRQNKFFFIISCLDPFISWSVLTEKSLLFTLMSLESNLENGKVKTLKRQRTRAHYVKITKKKFNFQFWVIFKHFDWF